MNPSPTFSYNFLEEELAPIVIKDSGNPLETATSTSTVAINESHDYEKESLVPIVIKDKGNPSKTSTSTVAIETKRD